jgi:hypothetical protein
MFFSSKQPTRNQTNKTLAEIVSTDLNTNPSKFIAFECDIHSKYGKYDCGGWSDRLKGIMAAYVWSLLTNRTFIINIARPCLLTSLIVPNQVSWDQPYPKEPYSKNK